jgi:hypothetical protein
MLSTGRLADKRQTDDVKTTRQDGGVAGTETIGGERCHQRRQKETDKRQGADDTDYLRRKTQLGPDRGYK